MTKFLAGVLSVIAVGVLLIAYGLLNPRTAAFAAPGEMSQFARPVLAGEGVTLSNDGSAVRYNYPTAPTAPYGYVSYPVAPQPVVQPVSVVQPVGDVRPVRTVATAPAVQRVRTTEVVERQPRRDWKKTALIIGGSTAGGAGVGGLIGGKKGALIGAAIGGGAGTLYEVKKH